jgi:hypothetical protein
LKIAVATLLVPALFAAQGDLDGMFTGVPQHPAIEYHTRPVNDVVAALNEKLQQGSVEVQFEKGPGYLRSSPRPA